MHPVLFVVALSSALVLTSASIQPNTSSPPASASGGEAENGHVAGRSPGQLPYGSLRFVAALSSCELSGGNPTADVQSSTQVDALVSAYVVRCDDRLFGALEDIYAHEKRNEAWASKLEEKADALKRTESLARMHVKGGCRSSLCRFDFEAPAPDGCVFLIRAFDRPIIDSTAGTDLQVSIIYRPNPVGCTRYLYSTVIPPAFLGPLRKKMRDGS